MNKIVRDRIRTRVATDRLFGLPVSMPLVLDLDGTLIAGDLLYKSFVSILRRNPLSCFNARHGCCAAAPR